MIQAHLPDCSVRLDPYHLFARYLEPADKDDDLYRAYARKMQAALFSGNRGAVRANRLEAGATVLAKVQAVLDEFSSIEGCKVVTEKLKAAHKANKAHIRDCFCEPDALGDYAITDRAGHSFVVRGSKCENMWRHLAENFPVSASPRTADIFCKTHFATWNLERQINFDATWPYLPMHAQTLPLLCKCAQLETALNIKGLYPAPRLAEPSSVHPLGFERSAKTIWLGLNVPGSDAPLEPEETAYFHEIVREADSQSHSFDRMSATALDILHDLMQASVESPLGQLVFLLLR